MPFDEQTCRFTLRTENVGTPSLGLQWLPNGVSLAENLSTAEWAVAKDWKLEASGINVHAFASATFQLSRKSYYSVTNYIVPTMLYWVASWLGLWISPDAVPARAAIRIIPVLTVTNKMNSL